ncbi:MAG: alpha-galactosidase [Spirochaetales bacterium]|nr:alpha-galactosidase [Spirochaetales bacterium]
MKKMETVLRADAVRVTDHKGRIVENFHVRKRESAQGTYRLCLDYRGGQPFHLGEICLYSGPHGFPAQSQFYGEGYQMLSQTDGTLERSHDVGEMTDRGHYKLPQVPKKTTVHSLLRLDAPSGEGLLLGFSSCHRFPAEFRFDTQNLDIVLKGDGIRVDPLDTLETEELFWMEGDRQETFETFAQAILHHHPRLEWATRPTGWCSWYCYGPKVTETDIINNAQAVAELDVDLDYVQIDDGYQAAMGDWLSPHPNFPRPIKELCDSIRQEGKQPAIWVAPFIAEKKSKIFQEHPDWFVRDEWGAPLLSSTISFGGWRRGPWYMLDGTHPQVRAHLQRIFLHMRQEWGVQYFKLDANLWGCLGGTYSDEKATRVQAYRAGMQAIVEAVGGDSFLLGCNAPMWPSLGLVHGMRTTGDVLRWPQTIKRLKKEGLYRNWQHKTLWLNDPDCAVLDNLPFNRVSLAAGGFSVFFPLKENLFTYHVTYLGATGGMLLSGDCLDRLSDRAKSWLSMLAQLPDVAAKFQGNDFSVGMTEHEGKRWHFFMNDSSSSRLYTLPIQAKSLLLPKGSVHQGETIQIPSMSGAIFYEVMK